MGIIHMHGKHISKMLVAPNLSQTFPLLSWLSRSGTSLCEPHRGPTNWTPHTPLLLFLSFLFKSTTICPVTRSESHLRHSLPLLTPRPTDPTLLFFSAALAFVQVICTCLLSLTSLQQPPNWSLCCPGFWGQREWGGKQLYSLQSTLSEGAHHPKT